MISLVQPSRGHITQFYAARQVDGNPHAGQDYAYSNGREIFPEVYAAADGVVLFAGDSRGLTWPNIMYLNPDFDRSDAQDSSAGNYTIIAHHDAAGNRIALTGYGHQEGVWAKAGDTVRAGQRIGTVGQTGFSAGKHLHFDLVLTPFRVNVSPFYGRVDPNPYFVAGITPQGTTTQVQEDEDMAVTDDDLRKIYDAVWFGAPGAKLIPNEAAGNSEWPYTTLGSLTARIGRDIVRPQLAELKGSAGQSSISPAEVADAVIAELGSDLAQIVVDEIGKRIAK